ncbi:hypothetical protein BH10ACT2_BH10ACT2_18740 [soil metagenome]
MRLADLLFVGLVGVVGCSSSGNTHGPFLPPPPTTVKQVVPSTTTTTATATSTTTATTTSAESTTTTNAFAIPTTTTLPLATAGGVIKVANATDVSEAAQQLSVQLGDLGFAVAEATNSAGKDEVLTVSKIYVKPGSEAVAESISYLMGGIEMFRMPTPAWIAGGTAALGDTTVLVMLGSDLAGSPLLVMRFEPGRQGPD